MLLKTRTLTTTESKLILYLEQEGIKYITLKDIARILGCTMLYARRLAHTLVEKGWLERLHPGKFRLISIHEAKNPPAENNPYIFLHYLTEPYYISYLAAIEHYGLSDVRHENVYVVIQRQRPPVTVRETSFQFVKAPSHKFFGWERIEELGEEIHMANLEKIIVDSIDRPELSGGIDNVIEMISTVFVRINLERLDDYIIRMDCGALARRTGFILELLGVKTSRKMKQHLLKTVSPNKVFLGKPQIWGTRGILHEEWNLIQNIPAKQLKKAIKR